MASSRIPPPVARLFGKYSVHGHGKVGYVDVEVQGGKLRMVAEKPHRFAEMQRKALDPRHALTAYLAEEDGLVLLRYQDAPLAEGDETCYLRVHGTYVGKLDRPTWDGHVVVGVRYSTRSSKAQFDGVIPVHLPVDLEAHLPPEGDVVMCLGNPVPFGSTMRVMPDGKEIPWPDLRIWAHKIKVQGVFYRTEGTCGS